MTYVALLRGINVGGNNRVEMKALKATFESLGLTHVKTYINSGNVIFADTTHTPAQLTSLLEKAIEKSCGFWVKVLVRDLKALKMINEALPTHWTNNTEMKCDVMFLWEEVDSPEVLKQLSIKEGIDTVRYIPGTVLWCVDRAHIGKSGLLKIVGTKLYKEMTIRNCNTARKLYQLMSAVADST